MAVLWEDAPFADAIELARRVAATALHVRKDVVTREAVTKAAAVGLPIRAWTVNDPGESARLAALGIEGIFTDFPERFLQPDRASEAGASG